MKGEKRIRRTNVTIIKDIYDAVLNIVKEKGYMALSLNTISEYSKLSPITITNRFSNIDDIVRNFISRYDMWLEIFTEDLPDIPTKESYQDTLKSAYNIVYRKKPVQQLLAWQITENSSFLNSVIEYQNMAIETFLDKYSEAYNDMQYDMKMITSLFLSAIFYAASYKNKEDFYGMDISRKGGLYDVNTAIRQLSDLLFEKIGRTKEKEIAVKMLKYGDDIAKIMDITGLSKEEVEFLGVTNEE